VELKFRIFAYNAEKTVANKILSYLVHTLWTWSLHQAQLSTGSSIN